MNSPRNRRTPTLAALAAALIVAAAWAAPSRANQTFDMKVTVADDHGHSLSFNLVSNNTAGATSSTLAIVDPTGQLSDFKFSGLQLTSNSVAPQTQAQLSLTGTIQYVGAAGSTDTLHIITSDVYTFPTSMTYKLNSSESYTAGIVDSRDSYSFSSFEKTGDVGNAAPTGPGYTTTVGHTFSGIGIGSSNGFAETPAPTFTTTLPYTLGQQATIVMYGLADNSTNTINLTGSTIAVPEPASVALLGLGLAGGAVVRLRRRRRARIA